MKHYLTALDTHAKVNLASNTAEAGKKRETILAFISKRKNRQIDVL